MLCDAVCGATMLGFHRPYIAVPSSLLSALTRDELDQVVLHEHAHAQRWDDWGKLAQALLQSALWMHPAMAIIGRRLNLEREIACDEWVVASSGQPKVYARCLLHAAEARNRVSMRLLLGHALFARKRDLRLRVDRLLAMNGYRRGTASIAAVIAGVCAVGVVAAQLRRIPLVGEIAPVTVRLKPDTTSRPGLAELPAVESTHRRTNESASAPITSAFAPFDISELRRDRPIAPDASASAPSESEELRRDRPNAPDASAFAPFDISELRRDRPIAPNAPIAPDAPIAPIAPIAPDLIAARTFEGRYVRTEPSAAIAENRAPWGTVAALGTEVGATARKTSVGIATTFTRAGASLARRF
jgi:hypothetical protein